MEGEYTRIRYDIINIYVCVLCATTHQWHLFANMGQRSSQVHKPPHRQKVIALYFSRANYLIILKT